MCGYKLQKKFVKEVGFTSFNHVHARECLKPAFPEKSGRNFVPTFLIFITFYGRVFETIPGNNVVFFLIILLSSFQKVKEIIKQKKATKKKKKKRRKNEPISLIPLRIGTAWCVATETRDMVTSKNNPNLAIT